MLSAGGSVTLGDTLVVKSWVCEGMYFLALAWRGFFVWEWVVWGDLGWDEGKKEAREALS